ncbi:hypothetical protein GCM10009764_14460 [Nocardia ninae]|uniref:Secreted protein n=1 Tax=Nocardia ninae NBRC 108245 TaxID=1210091 RepID=A0A511MUU8_9NOCA|nr:hypothetical protein NN4_85170 [Nocardia ninae NBRC 108245]
MTSTACSVSGVGAAAFPVAAALLEATTLEEETLASDLLSSELHPASPTVTASAAVAVATETRRILAGRSIFSNLSARSASGLTECGLGQANMDIRLSIAAQM